MDKKLFLKIFYIPVLMILICIILIVADIIWFLQSDSSSLFIFMFSISAFSLIIFGIARVIYWLFPFNIVINNIKKQGINDNNIFELQKVISKIPVKDEKGNFNVKLTLCTFLLEDFRLQEAKELYYNLAPNGRIMTQSVLGKLNYYCAGMTIFNLLGDLQLYNEAYNLGRPIFERFINEDNMPGLASICSLAEYNLVNNNLEEVEKLIKNLLNKQSLYSSENEYTTPFFILAEYNALINDKKAVDYYLEEARKKTKNPFSNLENYYVNRINNIITNRMDIN